MNSTFGNRPELHAQTSILFIHPIDAANRGIESGDTVTLFNDRGECELTAKLSTDIQPGVLSSRSVRWDRWNGRHSNGVNQLTSQRLTDIGAAATFYSCLVDLKRKGGASEPGRA